MEKRYLFVIVFAFIVIALNIVASGITKDSTNSVQVEVGTTIYETCNEINTTVPETSVQLESESTIGNDTKRLYTEILGVPSMSETTLSNLTTNLKRLKRANSNNVTVKRNPYLVSSEKCKIPNLSPFNKDSRRFYRKYKYATCSARKLLTYVETINNTATVYIDQKVVKSYSKDGVSCCYANITSKSDNRIGITLCPFFKDKIRIHHSAVYIKCLKKNTRKEVYANVHPTTLINKKIQKKLNKFDNTSNPLSVLIIGLDSISRLNFRRTLPETYKFVEKDGWIPLNGYNKINDNTYPNLMAILTGYNVKQMVAYCKTTQKVLDNCPLLWYDYQKLGYITAYGEDAVKYSTFHGTLRGFSRPPTDYYYRPYMIGTEQLHFKKIFDMYNYCTGPETTPERILHLAQEFSTVFKDYPNFGFFWANFAHENVNAPSGMDLKIKIFLESLNKTGVTNNSIIIFLSDHGMRFGPIRRTNTGWLEERLPFIYFFFPDWFKKKFSEEYNNFKSNIFKLTSPYDLYMTLQHILHLAGHKNYTIQQSPACPTCQSLFTKIKNNRECTDAGIPVHWCTCYSYKPIDLNYYLRRRIAYMALRKIHSLLNIQIIKGKCRRYYLQEVIGTWSTSITKNKKYIRIQFETSPPTVFETTVLYNEKDGNIFVSDDFNRLTIYRNHVKCVSGLPIEKLCYCKY